MKERKKEACTGNIWTMGSAMWQEQGIPEVQAGAQSREHDKVKVTTRNSYCVWPDWAQGRFSAFAAQFWSRLPEGSLVINMWLEALLVSLIARLFHPDYTTLQFNISLPLKVDIPHLESHSFDFKLYPLLYLILITVRAPQPTQYSCLENPMDRGVWWATVHGVAKSQTRLKYLAHSIAR